MDGVSVDVDAVETNIVIFDIAATGVDRGELLGRLLERGVRFSALMWPNKLRAVAHLDIPDDGVERALAALEPR